MRKGVEIMVRRLFGVAVLLAAMVLPTMAQVNEEPTQKWAVRLGVLYPTASDVRRATDTFWVYLGVERNFPGTGIVSLDYTEGSGAGVKYSHFALFLNQRQNYAPRLDLLAGLGVVYAKYDVGGDTDYKTRLGGTVGVAYYLNPRTELQLRYHTGSAKETNGIVLTLSLRF
jgi:hypothetical protein